MSTELEQSMEILLVEDSDSDAELCLRSLAKAHLANRVRWVKDGAEALELMLGTGAHAREATPRPRVVLLDLRLPKVDGLEVLRALKADERTRAVPVVVLTSSAEDRDIAETYRLGANSYIAKPVEFGEFSRVVAELGFYWLAVNRPPPGRP